MPYSAAKCIELFDRASAPPYCRWPRRRPQIVLQPGLDFTLRNSPTHQKYVVETICGGVAVIDYNGDGLLDVFLVNGGSLDDPVKVPVNFARGDPAYWNRLYRQNRDGSFTDVTVAAGLSKAGNSYGMGVAIGDYNNDGFPDIYVTNYGRNILYRNNGNGTFTDVRPQKREPLAGDKAGGHARQSR